MEQLSLYLAEGVEECFFMDHNWIIAGGLHAGKGQPFFGFITELKLIEKYTTQNLLVVDYLPTCIIDDIFYSVWCAHAIDWNKYFC